MDKPDQGRRRDFLTPRYMTVGAAACFARYLAAGVPLVVAIMFIECPCATASAQEAAIAGTTLTLDLAQPPATDPSQPSAQPQPQPDLERWWCELELTLWAPGIDGTVGARGVSTDLSVSFSDVLSDADSVIGLAGALLVGKGKVGGYVDGFWAQIGADAGTTPLGTVHVTSEIGILDFGVSYELGRWPMEWTAAAAKPARDLVLVGYAGGRYTNVDVELDFPVLPSRSQSQGWVDPMIGARLHLPLSPHWSLSFRGDIGGFGAASDFAWTAAGVVSWDFNIGELPSSLRLGYLAVGDDYSTGSGLDRFEWDTILHGLVLSFRMRF